MGNDPFLGIDDDYEDRMTEFAKLGKLADAGDDYDIGKFYTRSTNKFDHSINLQVPFPSDVVAVMDRMVNLRLVPEYTSRQALVRDAVVHRLHWLRDHVGDWEMGDLLALERSAAAAEARRALRVRQREIVETAEVELRELAQDQDWTAMETELLQLEATMGNLSEHWARKLGLLLDQYRATMARFS